MTHRTIRATLVATLAIVLTVGTDVAVAAQAPASRHVSAAAPVPLAVSAPESLAKGTRLYAAVRADSDLKVVGTLQWSSDQSKWTSTSTKVSIVDGQGALSFVPTQTAYYRVVGEGIQSDVWRTTLAKTSGYAISAGTRTAQVHKNESAYLVGTAVKGGKGGAYKVRVEYENSTGGWTSVGTVTAKKSGSFIVRYRPTKDANYRARILSSSGSTLATSAVFDVRYTSGESTLEERRSVLGWRLGSPTTKVLGVSSAAIAGSYYTGGASKGRFQKFANGILVEITTSSGAKQTWVLEGRQLDGYVDRKGWKGKLGLPEGDVKCGLLEGGCVQLFSRGAIYTNTSKMSKGIYVAYGRTAQVETLAAAYSQKGYEEPSWRESKYNTWADGTKAWCQLFVAWSTYAAGRKGEAPVNTYFPDYLAAVKASGVVTRDPKASDIRAGDILIFDWGTGEPSHTGFAVSTSGSWVYTFEGNTTDGSGDPQRGVYSRKRPLSGVWGVYHPGDYKAATS